MVAKLSIDFVNSSFEKEDYKLFTTEYKNKKGLLEYKCPQGHLGFICWSTWQQGSRCKKCGLKKIGDNRRLSYKEVKRRVELEGYKLISKEYKNNATNLEIECPKQHRHFRTFGDFAKGARCPKCNIIRQRTSIELIKKSFEDAGYKLLTTEYKNSRQRLDFVCPKGHRHTISWQSWKVQEARCNICVQEIRNASRRKKYDEIVTAFKAENYELLTIEYKNQATPLDYRCPKGHEFTTNWDYWYAGNRCPQCYLDSLNEKIGANWSGLVKEKDGNKCVLCGSSKNLHAHHLYSKSTYPHLSHDVNNGITLCYWHHRGYKNSFHAVFGYGNNTKEQFEEYVQMYLAGTVS